MSASGSDLDPNYSTPAALDEVASYKSIYQSSPSVEYPYDPQKALKDLPGISYALETFLASHMVEAEDYCNLMDQKKYPEFLSLVSS